MGVEKNSNAWVEEKTLPPIDKEEFDYKDFYITIVFSTFARYKLIDPRNTVFKPDQVFDKIHKWNVIRWQDGKMVTWEPGKEKQELKKQDKVFFVNCQYMAINALSCESPSNREMAKKLIPVVDYIKDFLNLQYVKGHKGTVHFNLTGYMPLDPMVHALRKLFDSKSHDKDFFKDFTKKTDELFKNDFERYKNSGFSFTVDYCCVIEGYRMKCRQMSEVDSVLNKLIETQIYWKELVNHNKRLHRGKKDDGTYITSPSIPSSGHPRASGEAKTYDTSIETPHIFPSEDQLLANHEKMWGLDSFTYITGNPPTRTEGYAMFPSTITYDDQIVYHGRPYFQDDIHKLVKYYDKLLEKERSKAWKQSFDFWWDNSQVRREEIQFQKYMEANTAVHREGESEQAKIREAQGSLKKQKEDKSSDEYKAYEVGRQVSEADGTLKRYHDVDKIEFDSQYIDLKELQNRYDNYENAMRSSDEYTRKKEEEAQKRIFWYPFEVIWGVIRTVIGIASFFFPVLLFVDLALELIYLGVKYIAKEEPFQWTDLIGVGIDLLCIWATRGGGAKAVFNSVADGAQIAGKGKAVEAANTARTVSKEEAKVMADKLDEASDVTLNNILKRSNQLTPEAARTDKTLAELHKTLSTQLNQLSLYESIVKAYSRSNNIGYIIYKEKLREVARTAGSIPKKFHVQISQFIQDGELFYANWKNLSVPWKVAFTGGVIMKDVIGNVWTAKGIKDNVNSVKDAVIDFSIYTVGDNSMVMIQ